MGVPFFFWKVFFSIMSDHEKWMRLALEEAEQAFFEDEVPVGAVMVKDGELVAKWHNRKEQTNSPLGHAELELIQQVALKLDRWRLSDCDLYVTLEPCLMCVGACLQARIRKLVFACRDPKAGAVKSLYNCAEDQRLNHQIEVVEGVLAEEASEMLTKFFRQLRKTRKLLKKE